MNGIITSGRVLESEYDAIVIGAGLGGLTTSGLLAKRGLRVLLVEQHSLPGGACTSFRREGRIFDAGAALIFGFGEQGYNLHRTLINYLEEPITIIPREKFFRLDFAGQQINVWRDLQKYIPELEKNFGDKESEIRRLYSYLMNFYAKYIQNQDLLTPPSEMSNQQKLKMLLKDPIRVNRLMKMLSQSAADLVKPYLKSNRLLEFFDKLCASYAYITMKETPAMMAITMFTDNHVGGTYYVAGSAQNYSNTLEKAVEKYGGTVLYDRKVEKIVFGGEKASGVLLNDGTELQADRIVSDTTVWNLYSNLLPRDKVTDTQRLWSELLVPTYPAMVLYLVVDKDAFPQDVNPVEYFITDTSNIDMGDITLYIPTVDDHSLGPPDEHVVTVFSPAPNQKWPRPFERNYQSTEYQEKKERQAALILEEIEKRFPGFRKGIKRIFVATPSTIERYTLKTWGCVGGPKQMIGQELTKRLHAKTDWPGLYACGDSTTMGMGTPAVVASGFGAANIILRELGLPEYHYKTFQKQYVNYIKSNPRPVVPDRIDNNPENARIIARECQYCEEPECVSACPTGTDIPGFIRRIEAGNYSGAARTIRETNPFAETCGYLCPSFDLCEHVCVRKTFSDKPVQIRELQRWVAEYADQDGWSPKNAKVSCGTVCVIGSGSAGLTCAYYLSRLGHKVDLFDTSDAPGGDLLDLVRSGSLSRDVLARELAGILGMGITFHGCFGPIGSEQLAELEQKYDAVYVTEKMDLATSENGFVEGMPKVLALVGSEWEAEAEIADKIRKGRRAAKTIHELLKKRR